MSARVVCCAVMVTLASCRDAVESTGPRLADLRPVDPKSIARLRTSADANPFGIYIGNPGGTPATGQALLDSLSASNIGWLRTGTWWREVEQLGPEGFEASRDTGDISRLIKTLQWARQRGQKAYVIIHIYPPNWARGGSSVPHYYEPTCDHFDEWAAFVGKVVDALDTLGVRHYSIHNEPADTAQFKTRMCHGPAWYYDYGELTRRAATVIKAKRAENKVIFWEQGSWDSKRNISLMPALSYLLQSLGSLVDIVGVHNYSMPPANQSFLDAAGGAFNEMNNVMAPNVGDKELWLTEFGGNALGVVPGQNRVYTTWDQRDNLARVLLMFLQSGRSPKWTKVFAFAAVDDQWYGMVSGINSNNASQLGISKALWAFNYIANRWAGTYNVAYYAYHFDERYWYYGQDGGDAPPAWWSILNSTYGLWGAQFIIPPAMRRAGVNVCLRYHLAYIGWLPNDGTIEYCNDNRIGPVEFGGQDHAVQAFQLRMANPLPTAGGGRMSLCGWAKPRGLNWISACSPANGTMSGVIGTTGQGRALLQLKADVSGDVR